jgi:predicted N-acetyltransferase YhbS
MTAAALAHSRKLHSGMRPVQPRRDMGKIGALIESAFAGQLDSVGLQMVRDMRSLGKAGWLGWILARLLLPPFANPLGYVWEEEGQLVGNASLLPVEHYPERWVLANVAVLAAYRRQGIASRLVQSTIDLARQIGARKVVLQVRRGQLGARKLYDSLGFRSYGTRSSWARPPYLARPSAPTGYPIRMRELDDWRAQWALANRVHPEGLIWPYPLTIGTFRPRRRRSSFGARPKPQWVWFEDGQLMASVSAKFLRQRRYWRLVLIVAPEAHGRVEGPMLATCLATLPRHQGAVLDHSEGAAADTIGDLGFHSKESFTWMGIDLG